MTSRKCRVIVDFGTQVKVEFGAHTILAKKSDKLIKYSEGDTGSIEVKKIGLRDWYVFKGDPIETIEESSQSLGAGVEGDR